MRTLVFLLLMTSAAFAQQSYSFTGLSTEDVLTIGQGLDKLPREETDKNSLYQRLQLQITKQNQDAAKAQDDKRKKDIDDAVKAAGDKKDDKQ